MIFCPKLLCLLMNDTDIVVSWLPQHSSVYHLQLPSSWYRSFSTLHTQDSSLYSIRCSAVHFTLYALRCTLYTVRFKLYALHCTIYTVRFTLYALHCTLNTVRLTLYAVTVRCTLYIRFTLYALHITLNTLRFMLNIALYTFVLHCALVITGGFQENAGNPKHPYLLSPAKIQIACCMVIRVC